MQGRGAPHSLVSVMRLPFVITTIMIMIAETARFLFRAFGKITDTEHRGIRVSRPGLAAGAFLFPFPLFPPAFKAADVFKPVGFAVGPQGARIKSIPSQRAKRRRTHRHQRQSQDRRRRAKRRRTHRHRRQSKDRHRRAKRRRPAAQQAKKSRRKARNGHADSKSFHAVPTGRPPSGRTGGAAIAATPHRREAGEKVRNGHADLKSFHAVPVRRPPSGRTGGTAIAATPHRREAGEKVRNGHADSKFFHAVPTGRPPSGRTGSMANRTRLPPQRQRKPPCADRRAAVRPKARTVSRKAAANRSTQERILSNAGPLFQSGKEYFEHRDFLHTAVCPRRAKRRRTAAQQAKRSRRKARNDPADSKFFHGAAIAATPHRRAAGGNTDEETPDSKSFHAVPKARPPSGQDGWHSNPHAPAAEAPA